MCFRSQAPGSLDFVDGASQVIYTRKEDGVVLSVLDIGFLLLGDKLPQIWWYENNTHLLAPTFL